MIVKAQSDFFYGIVWIFLNIHLNIIVFFLNQDFKCFLKDTFKKILRIHFFKTTKKQWSKGAGVAPYNMVGLNYANLCI